MKIILLLGFMLLAGCAAHTVLTLDDGTRTQTAVVRGTKANAEIEFPGGGKAIINQIGERWLKKFQGIFPSPVNVEK